MNNPEEDNYYYANLKKFTGFFDHLFCKYLKNTLTSRYKDVDPERVIALAKEKHKEIILVLPDIGGDANVLTDCLIGAVPALALYQSLKLVGKDPLDGGIIFNEILETLYASGEMGTPAELEKRGAEMFSPQAYQRMKEAAKLSQLKKYPEDFVYTFVEGDGSNFNFGWDFSECAVVKLFKRYGAAELAVYACKFDFIESKYCKTGLKRELTLANGDVKCDFRFKKQL